MSGGGIDNLAYEDNNEKNFQHAEPNNAFSMDDSHKNNHFTLATTESINPQPKAIDKFNNFLKRHKQAINRLLITLLHIAVGSYFAYATYYYIYRQNTFPLVDPPTNDTERCNTYCGIEFCDGYGMLLLLLSFIYIGLLYYLVIVPLWGAKIYQFVLKPLGHILAIQFKKRSIRIVAIVAIIVAFIMYLYFDTYDSRDRLQSLAGIFSMLLLGFVFSKHPTKIKFRPVLCGLLFQFLLGLFCIRWDVGRSIFRCIGRKVAIFLDYSKEGAEFVYGTLLVREEVVFSFGTLPAIFFFSFFISILYYLGVMQWVVLKLGWILQVSLGTTICESVTCAANIFIGMSESPLLIGPFIKYLTHSEMHVIMASGFATVSGTVLGIYISYGAEAAHLVTSSVMAAPAALAFSKLFYPETEESLTTSKNITIEKSTDTSLLDAASNGALKAIWIVLGITANIIAFVSFIAFLNGVVNWLGWLVGIDDLTFELICAYIFMPLAWVMGVEWNDCQHVASVVATKSIVNEFAAYQKLGKLKLEGAISLRSSAIATYAICGFANPSSVGVMIGALSAICPEKKSVIVDVAIRGFFAGSMICFITASIAGLLMTEDNY